MTDDKKLAMSQAKPLPGLRGFKRNSREVCWEHQRCGFFWKEVQDKVQDITGVVSPNDFKNKLSEKM